jgi:hypothetical protein
VPPRKGPYEAGGSEDAGRVMEPRHVERCGQQASPQVCGESRRLARAGRPQSWARDGQCARHPRGLRAGHGAIGGTRERGRAAGLLVADPEWGSGGPKALACPGASTRSRARAGAHTRREHARSRGTSDKCRPPRGAGGSRRVAEERGRWGTEAQGTHGREGDVEESRQWQETGGRARELPPPDHGRPGDCTRVGAALLEDP